MVHRNIPAVGFPYHLRAYRELGVPTHPAKETPMTRPA